MSLTFLGNCPLPAVGGQLRLMQPSSDSSNVFPARATLFLRQQHVLLREQHCSGASNAVLAPATLFRREQHCSRSSNTVLARATLFSLEQHCSRSSNTVLARATLFSLEQHCSRSSNTVLARAT